MRAWIEPDDDIVPILSIETTQDGRIIGGTYITHFPFKWRLDIEEVPE